jgi:hypothetical protein
MLMRRFAAQDRWDPARESRAYAYPSFAQHDAVSGDLPFLDTSPAIHRLKIGSASADVVAELCPEQQAQARSHEKHPEASDIRSGLPESQVTAAVANGRRSAASVLARAQTDDADLACDVTVPSGMGSWRSSIGQPPLRPCWGDVRPLLVTLPDDVLPGPAPLPGSLKFASALEEVRRISESRTEEQKRIADYWADGPGTSTPPGQWNEIASELVLEHGMSDFAATKVLALTNMAMMDAGIVCWRAKYMYWVARPSQMDAAITPSITLPNFPSYPSGHAAFSGAASEVLTYFFPKVEVRLRSMAEEAAMSRVYGGIHYRFDSEEGLALGRTVSRLALRLLGRPGGIMDRLV